jgi:hypothetical protein
VARATLAIGALLGLPFCSAEGSGQRGTAASGGTRHARSGAPQAGVDSACCDELASSPISGGGAAAAAASDGGSSVDAPRTPLTCAAGQGVHIGARRRRSTGCSSGGGALLQPGAAHGPPSPTRARSSAGGAAVPLGGATTAHGHSHSHARRGVAAPRVTVGAAHARLRERVCALRQAQAALRSEQDALEAERLRIEEAGFERDACVVQQRLDLLSARRSLEARAAELALRLDALDEAWRDLMDRETGATERQRQLAEAEKAVAAARAELEAQQADVAAREAAVEAMHAAIGELLAQLAAAGAVVELPDSPRGGGSCGGCDGGGVLSERTSPEPLVAGQLFAAAAAAAITPVGQQQEVADEEDDGDVASAAAAANRIRALSPAKGAAPASGAELSAFCGDAHWWPPSPPAACGQPGGRPASRVEAAVLVAGPGIPLPSFPPSGGVPLQAPPLAAPAAVLGGPA